MKKIMVGMLALSFLAGTTVFAQDKMDSSTDSSSKKKKKSKKQKSTDTTTTAPKTN
jgi:uncharacterized protein YxeA